MGLKGQPKTGGRKKGTPNKAKHANLLEVVRAALGDPDYHPVVQMAQFSLREDFDPPVRAKCASDVARYSIAVPKQLDLNVAGQNGGPVELVVVTGVPRSEDG